MIAGETNGFEIAIPVTGRDEQSRAVGRPLHGNLYLMPDHKVQGNGRVVDGEECDLGTTVMGDVAASDERYPLREHEDWAWDVSARVRRPPAWDLMRIDALPAVPALAPGDLLLAKHGRWWPDDRSDAAKNALRLHRCAVAGRGMSMEEAAGHVAAGTKGRLCGPKEPSSVGHEAESAREARKPNETFARLYRAGLEHRSSAVRILPVIGGWFFHRDDDDAAEAGINVPGNAYGFFVLLDGRPWSHGDRIWEEHDSSVDGNWRRRHASTWRGSGLPSRRLWSAWRRSRRRKITPEA